MLDQRKRETEAMLNRAKHAVKGTIQEARELWKLSYRDNDDWICVDDNCRARMIPCAWMRPNDQAQFCKENGVPYKRTPYFRADPAHSPGCRASIPSGPHGRDPPEFHTGPPADYPNRVILFADPRHTTAKTESVDAQRPQQDGTEKRHAHSVRGIKGACEYYADHPDQRWRALQVDQCSGRTYNECFVKLGTGEANGVGKNWIFFDQIRFRSRIDFDVEPLVLPLLSNVNKLSRRLVILTSEWLDIDQLDFRDQLKIALRSCKAAYNEGKHERHWIFFFGQEAHYDDVDFRAELQSRLAVLVRDMRWAWGPLRSSMHIPSKRQMPKEDISPEPRLSMGEVALLNDQTKDKSAQHRAEAEPRTESLSTNATATTCAPNGFPEEGLRSLKDSLPVQDSDPTAGQTPETPEDGTVSLRCAPVSPPLSRCCDRVFQEWNLGTPIKLPSIKKDPARPATEIPAQNPLIFSYLKIIMHLGEFTVMPAEGPLQSIVAFFSSAPKTFSVVFLWQRDYSNQFCLNQFKKHYLPNH